MNRYQHEVAEMDRRHRLLTRALSFVGAAVVAMATLWSAGLPPSKWLQLASWWESSTPQSTPTATRPQDAAMPGAAVVSAAQVADKAAVEIASTIPAPLYLVATAPGRNSREGTAQIGTNPENPQTFTAGAILANGARLREIYAERVVLERGTETLTLYTSGKSSGALRDRSKGTEHLAIIGGAAAPAKVESPPERRLTDVVRSMPLYQDETLVGLRIVPGREAGLFAQLGLQTDDVITALEGAPIADASSATDLLRTLTDGAVINVTIRRGANTKIIALDGSLITAAQTRSALANQAGSMPGAPAI